MQKRTIDDEEVQRRLLLLQDYKQWRAYTGSNSRIDYAQERGMSLQYLVKCLKWHFQICKRKDQNIITSHIGPKPKEFPSLIEVSNKAKPIKSTTVIADSAIRIRMRASSIEIAGDVDPTLLTQLISTLGALNVL